MKILHLTDIHLTTPGKTIGGRDPNLNFEKALQDCIKFHADSDAMVISGDLSDWAESDDYERLKQLIANLPFPVHLCIGNHDDRDTMLSSFPALEGENGFIHYTFDLPNGTGIVLDTWAPQTHHGELCETRLNWLDKTLRETEGNVFIFMHHNFIPNRIIPQDKIMLQEPEKFGEIISSHADKVRHICHGHCHVPMSGNFHGVSFSAPRGTNHAGWFDFAEEHSLSSSNLPEAYCVLRIDESSVLTQMIEYGYNGPIKTEGSPTYSDWDKKTMVR